MAQLKRGRVSDPAQAALSGSQNEAPGSAGGNLTEEDGRELKMGGGSLSRKDEGIGPVRLVVFLADRKTGRVLGAAEQALSR